MKNLENPIEFAKHLRRSETSGEYLMWQLLRNRQRCGMKFRRQHPIGPYYCDFFCADVRLVIECDGKDHFTEEGKAYDGRRSAWLERQGITILRFTNQQIENETQVVMQIIDAKLIELSRPSPPAPLPEDGARGARDKGYLPEDRERGARDKGCLPEDGAWGARDKGCLPEDGARGARDKGYLPEDGARGARDKGYLPEDRERGARDKGRLSEDGERGARDKGRLSEDRERGARDEGRFLEDRERGARDEGRFLEDRERGARDEGYLPEDRERVASDEGRFLEDGERGASIARGASVPLVDGKQGAKFGSRAMTLVELLVVLVVVSTLAAATLPAFKNAIVERKTSVAALEVKGFLDSARARAIARGRPVSVILERLSSRWDGVSVAPRLSETANNTPTTLDDNFDVYNTCIRMTVAETLRSTEFEIPVAIVQEDVPTGSSQPMNDNDGVLEPCRILSISNSDARLANELAVGHEIELVDQNAQSRFFRIRAVALNSGFYIVAINNEGSLANPYGSYTEVNSAAAIQTVIQPFTALVSPMSKFLIRNVPKPVASMVIDLPRGSCIDLSLSGLTSDDPHVNPTSNVYRDCRREFASDWVLPPTLGGLPPIPSQLRPVFLTFSPSGTLTSILCNTPQVGAPTAGNPLTYMSLLRRIEPHSDVCLFVGRTDQVVRAGSASMLAAADDIGIKPNLMDTTGYWVRISPTSGAISAAPAQASHIIDDVEVYRATNTDETIGHLLQDSRSLIFGAELTSQ